MAEITSPFDDILFRLDKPEGGFQNDVTPLDEYNMNLIIKAILENKENMESNDNNLRTLLSNEETTRIGADAQLRTDLTNESSKRETTDQQLTNAISSEASTRESKDNELADGINQLTENLELLNFNVIEIDGGGVPTKNLDTWNGEYDDAWGNV